MATKKEDNEAERRARVDDVLERERARRESERRHQLHLMWESGLLRCALVTTDNQVVAVQLFNDKRAILTEPCRDADVAASVAERLWDEFVE